MATSKKRPLAKAAARKSVRKAVASKPAAKKSTTKKQPKKLPNRLAAPAVGKAKKATKAKASPSTGKKSAAPSTRTPQAAKKRAAKPVRVKKVKRVLSPAAKKNLATKHLWALVEEKKRLATLPPPWQNIGHHDHSATGATTVETTPPDAEPEKFHIGGRLDRGGS